MTRLLQVGHALLLVAAIALLSTFAYWTARVAKHADNTLMAVDGVLDDLDRPCGTSKPCGTLADVAKTLGTARGAIGQVEVAAAHENANLTTLYAQEQTLFKDLHTTAGKAQETLTALSGTAQASTETMRTTQTTIAGLEPLETAATATMRDTDALVASPDLKRMLAAVAGSSEHVQVITGDAQFMADKFAHPPAKKWYQKIGIVAEDAGKASLYFFTHQ